MKYVIVGGGIAGVSCANEIIGLERCPKLEVVLVSGSSSVKSVENYRKIGQYGEKFDVKEADSSEIFPDKRFKFLHATVTNWDAQKKQITLQNGETLKYDKLCIATGSRPKLQDELGSDSRFLFLRDTQSARELQNQLGNAKHLLIVGNGGIATELIYELKNVFVTWLVRDAWICASFFPDDVEKFVEDRLLTGRSGGKKHDGVQKHLQYSTSSMNAEKSSEKLQGPALGPDWCSGIDFGVEASGNSGKRSVKILRNSVIGNIETSEELVVEYLDRSTGVKNSLKPDLIIWAGGVVANSEVWREERSLETAHNGGIAVNDACETSIPDVYGCGDVSMLTLPESSLWKQRQLWTQARQLGEVCGRAMAAGAEEARMQNMYFELFSHCTTFFGLKVGKMCRNKRLTKTKIVNETTNTEVDK
ncbi:hypothetical protein L3Y34_017288 [Caenorhabditis briggsae]|uniref:FAD/NAD(P)-binding domain-containing protein n=1 Tax=Caenorhabditis briggsae TaxID=6238 RepID=A0AAE9DI61_CAEBR|nr:hypothetical protein L3Y34_017288 [Caenorhabditis briggsae]